MKLLPAKLTRAWPPPRSPTPPSTHAHPLPVLALTLARNFLPGSHALAFLWEHFLSVLLSREGGPQLHETVQTHFIYIFFLPLVSFIHVYYWFYTYLIVDIQTLLIKQQTWRKKGDNMNRWACENNRKFRHRWLNHKQNNARLLYEPVKPEDFIARVKAGSHTSSLGCYCIKQVL